MKKLIVSLWLVVCLLVALLPRIALPASAATDSGTCGDNLIWTFDDSTGTLTISGTGPMEEWWSYEDVPWMERKESVKTVTITHGVTTISSLAFSSCTELTAIVIPDSITSIGDGAFDCCFRLISVTIPNSVRTIGENAFGYCHSLVSVTIPYSVASIGIRPFEGCSNLLEISVAKENLYYCNDESGVLFSKDMTTLVAYPSGREGSYSVPDGVTTISSYAFWMCYGLTSVTIPNSVTSIGDQAFSSCSSLATITVPDSVVYFGSNAVYNTAYYRDEKNWANDILYVGNHLVQARDTLSGSCVVREGTITISGFAFDNSTGLTSVTIPNSVIAIGDCAFQYCTGLASVTISDSITSIGEKVFDGCTGLTSVTIPNGVTAIGNCAFQNCTGLTSVTIPDNVTKIGAYAFQNCIGLDFISIGNGVSVISSRAFSGCSNLTKITIPDSVNSIGSRAFENCTALAFVTMPDHSCTIGTSAFYNTAYYNDNSNWSENVLYIGNHLIQAKNSLSGAYAIKGGIVSIAQSAFLDCTGLTAINIPKGITFIYAEVFRGCSALAELAIPEGVTEIYGAAFEGCSALTHISIPESVESIGGRAFHSCTQLAEINLPDGLKYIYQSAFENTTYYNDDSNWKNGALYIGEYLIKARKSLAGSCTVQEGTLTIAMEAFMDCRELNSVIIPNSVAFINPGAFEGCTALTDVYYSGSKEMWDKITIEINNDSLLNATIHFMNSESSDDPTEPVENPFEDVAESDYFAEPVLWAVEQGITTGTSAGKFSPERACTRGQIVTFLWRAAGSPEPKSTENPFTDISAKDYYYKAVLWAVENEITTGTGKGKFSPEKPCTRGQVATFLWRAEGKPEPASTENPFGDIASGEYYYDAVLWAVEQGITNGTGKDKFSPDKDCTRGQIVTFLYRAMA